MKNKIKKTIFIGVFASLLFGNSCSFVNPVKDLSNKIKQMDIVFYEIKWLVNMEQPYQHQEYKTILEGKDKDIIKSIKTTMNDIDYPGGSAFTTIHQAAQGMLILKDINEKVEQIDISEVGFFVGGNRSENALFHAKGLTKIIKDMISKTDFKNKLVLTNDFFEKLIDY